MRQPTAELFLTDVAEHEMTVVNDNGVYRHLIFKKPGRSEHWFEIVTWPWRLTITGDMGTYVFSRLEDMFQFFRADGRDTNGLYVNLGYWGEKLQAVDTHSSPPGHTKFRIDSFKDHVGNCLKEWLEYSKLSKADARELREQVESMYAEFDEEDERGAQEAATNFSCEIGSEKFEFSDSWEWYCKDFTFHYVWCCFAIAWAIKKYDALAITSSKAEAA